MYQTLALYSRRFQSSAPLTLPFSLFCPLCAWLIRAELEFSLRLILLYLLRDYLLTSCDSLKGTVGSASHCGCTHTHAWLFTKLVHNSSIAEDKPSLPNYSTQGSMRLYFRGKHCWVIVLFSPSLSLFLVFERVLLDSDKPDFQSLMEIQSKCFL